MKDFTWNKEDMFEFDGKEFEVMYNQMKALVNTQQVKEAMTIVSIYNILHEKFKKYVENGTIKEKDSENKEGAN